MSTSVLRYDWTKEEIREIHDLPLIDLVYKAQQIHRQTFTAGEVQKSTLLSIKTGGCPEDCGYCPQAARYHTNVERHGLLPLQEVIASARQAKQSGSTRFCMGAAWREVKDGEEFDQVLDMVREVSKMGMEVCCTLGMLTKNQAEKLKEAGLGYYNHNLDTSPEFYGEIITTRAFDDRLQTLRYVRDAGIHVCCGGIIGMGENVNDRVGLLHQLATQNPHPESVPINMLVRVEGTPLATQPEINPLDFVRMIATARILMPTSFVRLSAGRRGLTPEAQALCFLAGANSIFSGDKLLTTPNPDMDDDRALFAQLGLTAMPLPLP